MFKTGQLSPSEPVPHPKDPMASVTTYILQLFTPHYNIFIKIPTDPHKLTRVESFDIPRQVIP